jgi:nucleoid DNA-binding protein
VNYNKRKLLFYIAKEIYYRIHYSHIFSIINILLEELSKDLTAGKEITIGNFGRFYIKTLGSKKNINVVNGQQRFTKKVKSLRFKLSREMIKKCEEKKE